MHLTAFLRVTSCWHGYLTPKILRVMKLTAILLCTACMSVAARSEGQKVTLDLKKAPIQKVFKEVSRQTGVSIVYNEALFEGFKPVTIKVNDASIEDVLDKCLQ